MQILDGKTLSEKIIDNLSLEIRNSKLNINLDIVLVGDDPASLKYVELKNKKAEIWEMSFEEAEKIIDENAKRLFKIL